MNQDRNLDQLHPMAHRGTLALESLNAAAATAVALFECQRQRLSN